MNEIGLNRNESFSKIFDHTQWLKNLMKVIWVKWYIRIITWLPVTYWNLFFLRSCTQGESAIFCLFSNYNTWSTNSKSKIFSKPMNGPTNNVVVSSSKHCCNNIDQLSNMHLVDWS